MRIDGDDYKVLYDGATSTVYFSGTLRLFQSSDYKKIEQFLLQAHNLDIASLTIDFRDLLFMNSLGINMLCKFIIKIKKIGKLSIKIVGNKGILWQVKSFQNLKLLWDKIELQFA
jgi:hypothetical protein